MSKKHLLELKLKVKLGNKRMLVSCGLSFEENVEKVCLLEIFVLF